MSVDGRGWLLEGIILHQPTYNCSTKNNQICVWFQKALEKHLYWDQWILKLTLSQLLILILLSGSITSKWTAGFDDFSIMIVRSNDFLIVNS